MTNPHDQYFTDSHVALHLVANLVARLDPHHIRTYLEPSCGTGVFVQALLQTGIPQDQIRTVDIDSVFSADIHADFLMLTHADLGIPTWNHATTIVIGNPPFGRLGSLARKFINHAAIFGRWVCMVVPRSMYEAHNCGNLLSQLDLFHEEEIPEGSFSDTNTRCNWQEWFLLSKEQVGFRPIKPAVDTLGLYKLVTKDDEYDVVIQRCGVSAGTVTTCNGTGEGKYYIATSHPDVLEAFKSLGKHPLAFKAAQQPTLSARLLHELFVHAFMASWSRKLGVSP